MLAPVDEARRLYREARAAKTEQTRQRHIARARMEDLQAFCDEHGISIEFITLKGEGSSHGRTNPDP